MYEELIKRLQDFAAETERDKDAQLAFEAVDAIEDLSKERKTGKWEDKGHDNIYQCSVCSDLWMGIGGYRFCPNCGAKMEGDNIDETF